MNEETCAIRPYDDITINYDWLFNLAYSEATKLKRLRKVTIIEAGGRDLLKGDGYEVYPSSIGKEEVDQIMADLEISEGDEMKKDLNSVLRILGLSSRYLSASMETVVVVVLIGNLWVRITTDILKVIRTRLTERQYSNGRNEEIGLGCKVGHL
jgi:hypothetical protein